MTDPRLSIIPAGAVLDRRLEARDLQVLCLFGRHTDRKGWCRRSQVQMAKEIGCARSTVQGSIDRLVAAGWIEKRGASDVHTPGVRDSAAEYRVVLDTLDDTPSIVATPADQSAPLPEDGEKSQGQRPDSGHRHPPAPGAAIENAGLSRVQNVVSSAPMLTTPSNDKTPQPPETGGSDFSELWESWPLAFRGMRENAEGTFRKLSAFEQLKAIGAVGTTIKVLGLRKHRLPFLKSYLTSRIFEEFFEAPDVDFDGDFVIRPANRDEWNAWLGDVRKAHGDIGVERAIMPGKLVRKTRWPEGHPAHIPPLRRERSREHA